jgi:hypothetical protein
MAVGALKSEAPPCLDAAQANALSLVVASCRESKRASALPARLYNFSSIAARTFIFEGDSVRVTVEPNASK